VVCRIRVRGHQSGRREDHAQADWAELDAIDNHRERFSPRSIAPEIVAKAIRYRQRRWNLLWWHCQENRLLDRCGIGLGCRVWL
jgi:hypothetical protein